MFNDVFGESRSIEEWNWEFLENPVKRIFAVVAEHEGKIVGQYALLPKWMNVEKRRVLGALSVDTMVHPLYRNQGLFVSLAKECYRQASKEGVSVVYGFPNKNSYHGFIYNLGWHEVGRLPKLVRILNPERVLQEKLKSKVLATMIGRPARCLIDLFPRSKTFLRAKHVTVERFDCSDGRLDSFLSRASWHPAVSVWKDRSYLRWRYFSFSRGNYTAFAASDADSMRSLIIFKIVPPKDSLHYAIGYIVDFWFLPDSIESGQLLLSHALTFLRHSGVDLVVTHVFKSSCLCPMFRKFGFIKHGADMPLIVNTLSGDVPHGATENGAGWHFTPGDIDIY